MSRRFGVSVFLCSVISISVYPQSKKNNMHSDTNKKPSEFEQISTEVDGKMYSMAADLSALGENANVLFFDNKCIIVGKDKIPVMLSASVEFNPASLPIALQDNIYSVESITISSESGVLGAWMAKEFYE